MEDAARQPAAATPRPSPGGPGSVPRGASPAPGPGARGGPQPSSAGSAGPGGGGHVRVVGGSRGREMRGKCVAQSCRGRTRQLAGGGPRGSGGSRRPTGAAATGLFRAAAGAGRLPRRAGVPGAGGCALRGPLPGHRFRAGSPGPSAGCKQGGALCPPAPGLPGRAAGGARSGGGAGAALGSGGGGAPASAGACRVTCRGREGAGARRRGRGDAGVRRARRPRAGGGGGGGGRWPRADPGGAGVGAASGGLRGSGCRVRRVRTWV
ncbi:translation initiation factor IF-2-like [Vulpes lagopus]|uniref:translation initiation factor IF-2-like n=1 Tax=Vulpes lagopus TaxID=494514 RepID=UPI001BCA208E|nr:translation initiation factor IF-2-like [Vulpes lagopus]